MFITYAPDLQTFRPPQLLIIIKMLLTMKVRKIY